MSQRLLVPSLLLLNLISLSLLLYSQFQKPQAAPFPMKQDSTPAPAIQVLASPLPDSASFAGGRVPLEEPRIRELLDFAFAKIRYRHAMTGINYKRAQRWFPEIEKQLQAEGLPEDLKYLAVIESNLSNMISPKGATGFWQFMPATARQYGLEVSAQVDERYHPIKSTQAAIKYFQDAYRIFEDWNLVAASYNMGMNGLRRRLEQQKVNSYYDLYLNPETGAYVFYAIATKYIFENPEQYGFVIPDTLRYEPLPFRRISVKKSLPDLITFALENGSNYATLKTYNPWLRQKSLSISRPGQEYKILLPK